MKKKQMLGILAVLLVGLLAVGVFASPFGGKGRGEGMLYSDDAAKAALEAGDYAAFVSAIKEQGRTGRMSEMTEEHFSRMVERQKQREAQMAAMQETRDAVHNALESGDYYAWHAAVSSLEPVPVLADKITQENFDAYLRLHSAKKSKDWGAVKAAAEELGLDRPGLGIGGGKGIGSRGAGMGPGFHELKQGNGEGKNRLGKVMGQRMGSFSPRMPAE